MVSPSDAAVFASRTVDNWNELTLTALVEVSKVYNLSTSGQKKAVICQQLFNYFNPPPSAPSSSRTQHGDDVIHITYADETGQEESDLEDDDFLDDVDDAARTNNDADNNNNNQQTAASPTVAAPTIGTDSSWNPDTQERIAINALVNAASAAPIVSPVASNTNALSFVNRSLRTTVSPRARSGGENRDTRDDTNALLHQLVDKVNKMADTRKLHTAEVNALRSEVTAMKRKQSMPNAPVPAKKPSAASPPPLLTAQNRQNAQNPSTGSATTSAGNTGNIFFPPPPRPIIPTLNNPYKPPAIKKALLESIEK